MGGLAVGVAASVVLAGGVAVAAIPSTSTGLISGCRTITTGALRVIDYQAGKRCTTKERTLTWNVRGPQGLRGLTGAVGAKGAIGSTGPVGMVGPTGTTGLAGTPGLPGTPGLTGLTGDIGPAGPVGPAGPQGVAGPGYVYGTGTMIAFDTGRRLAIQTLTISRPSPGLSECRVNVESETPFSGFSEINGVTAVAQTSLTQQMVTSTATPAHITYQLSSSTQTITVDYWVALTAADTCTTSWRYLIS